MAEVRVSSSYNHVVHTPRIGGCTGAFFNLFDWNSKRFASTKRLPAERPEKTLRRSKSFRDGESRERPSAKTASEKEATSNAPGLVARLMGLESLPEVSPALSKHRRARSCSGSESVSDSRGAKLALRDLLKQEHESFENFCSGGELALVPVPEQRVRKVAAQTPIGTLVPYVDSPAGSCRTVYALPWKGEKSPFLARLHPSPVLQPSKCHNQMVSPAKTSPGGKKMRASRFLEAAVKILEEISDNEVSFPRERELAASSPPSSGTDLLHCRSMSRIWNGSEDTDSGRSTVARSFRGSQRRDRICRDIFETSLSERAPSVSPRPLRSSARNPKEVKGRPILRTQEAAVGEFKTDVRRASESMPTFADSVQFMQRTTTAPAARRSLVPAVDIPFSSDDEYLTDQLVRIATSGAAPVTPTYSKPQKKVSSSVGNSRVKRETSPAPLRVRSSSVSLHEGMRLPGFRGDASSEFAKPRSGSASAPSHSRQFSGQMDELKLSVRVKREKQVRESPAVQCHSPMPNTSPLKRPRRKNRLGSPRLRESSSQSKKSERRMPPSPKHRNVEAKSPARISTRALEASSPGKLSAKQAPVQTLDDVVPEAAMPEEVELKFPDDAVSPHVEHAQGTARDLFPEVAESSNLDELLVLGMHDLHWDHGMVEQQRENSSRSRYCEIRASGESLQSICDATLDEDVCNVDDGTSPSPSPSPLLQKFAGECSDSHDESSTSVLMKRFLGKPLRLDVDMGETSPVSVLDSPFGDEVCTTSESSMAESERQQAVDQQADSESSMAESERQQAVDQQADSESSIADQQAVDQQTDSAVSLTEVVEDHDHGTELEVVSTLPSEPTPGDRVRQAILDISSFRRHDRAPIQASPQTEKTFVRQVLSAAQLLSSPGRSPNWYERDLAVDPSLFERLEGGDATSAEDGDFLCESGGMWRCDRKLLFDCVNEAFSQNVRLFKDPQPWLPRRPVLRTRPPRQKLVDEVQEKINGWRQLASHAIDTLIDVDMSTRVGKWTDFSEEVAEVGAEIECMVWQVMVEELVLELLHR